MATGNQFAAPGTVALSRDQSRAVFGQVMGLVAITVGFSALGAYIGRDLKGGVGLVMFISVFRRVLGLVLFGGFTIFDFNGLRRTDKTGAVPIAASIFLDIFNVFLFFLQLFGGGGRN